MTGNAQGIKGGDAFETVKMHLHSAGVAWYKLESNRPYLKEGQHV